ncbi:MAG: hypothetical protein Q4D16_10485 [Eubacteriales bacterium]|nr:hypothetical protein [Eubacteriales bacterium]
MNRKQHSFVTVGITSLFLIFGVLCLVILSLLTLGTSRSDLRMSRRSLEQTTAYYDSCSNVTDFCRRLDQFLSEAYTETDNKGGYYEKVNTMFNNVPDSLGDALSHTDVSQASDETASLSFSYDETSRRLSVSAPFSDSQVLQAELEILYPERAGDSYLQILAWKTDQQGSWDPDTKQPVYKGEVTIQ